MRAVSTGKKLGALGCLVIMLAACQATSPKVENGFIRDYDRMELIERDDGTIQHRWIDRSLTRLIKPVTPSAFFIKPVVFYPKLETNDQFGIEASQAIQEYFDKEVARVTAKHFKVTNTLGPNVFVIEPAFTSMRISLESMSPLEVLPFKAVLSGINYATGGRDRDVEVRLEMKVSEAQSQKLLATSVLRGEGMQLENDTEQLSKEHIKALLDNWVNQWDALLGQYRKQLDERG